MAYRAETDSEQACAACGTVPRRARARFCETCGRGLGEEYFPTEALRASYSFERRAGNEASNHGREASRARPARRWAAQAARPRTAEAKAGRRAAELTKARRGAEFMFVKQENNAAATGLAFVTYALVPYLGILFCPGALVMGGVGLWRARRGAGAGGGRAALLSIALGLLVLCAQLLLWWILYKAPEWAQGY
jgi:hypothetical protein